MGKKAITVTRVQKLFSLETKAKWNYIILEEHV